MSIPSSAPLPARGPQPGPTLRSSAVWATAALFALTAAVAVVVAAVPGLADRVDAIATVRLLGANLPHTPGEVLRILLNNTLVIAGVLAAADGRRRFGRLGRRACDVAAAVIVLRSGVLVGAVLGANGSALVPYLVHLPLEWAALGTAAGAWLLALRRPLTSAELLHAAQLALVLLAIAAVLETYATPR